MYQPGDSSLIVELKVSSEVGILNMNLEKVQRETSPTEWLIINEKPSTFSICVGVPLRDNTT